MQRLAGVIWRAHYPGIITPAQIDYMLERGYALDVLGGFLARPDRGLELAKVDGELAGFAAWYITDDPRRQSSTNSTSCRRSSAAGSAVV